MAAPLHAAAVAVVAAAAAAVCIASPAAAAVNGLGPGPGAWETASPEAHGLSTKDLEAAAARIEKALPLRWCFVVVKDGYIVHESYFANNSETKYRTQSLGKTSIAAMIGALVTQGRFNLDTPLERYGVPRGLANWSVFGTDYFSNVTARHLLGQASGYGMLPPGTAFTYDSDDYIQHLSYLMDATGQGDPPVATATRAFAEPLGVPELFAYDGQVYGIGGNISTGGGQMMTCRDVARVGTLVVNGGRWKDASGAPTQLVSADYVSQMSRPSFPEFNKGYGFLTWLNAEVDDGDPHCCAPRWSSRGLRVNQTRGNETRVGGCCQVANGSKARPLQCDLFATQSLNEELGTSPRQRVFSWEGSQYIERSIVDDNTPAGLPQAPHDLMMGQGEQGQYMFMIPSLNLSVVTMGSSIPRSMRCAHGYDDAFTVSLAWNAISSAFLPPGGAVAGDPGAALPPPAAADRGERLRRDSKHHGRAADSVAAPRSTGVGALMATSAPVGGLAADDDLRKDGPTAGSCQCDCPYDLGFGRCFDVPASALPAGSNGTDVSCNQLDPSSAVSAKIHSPGAYCPGLGMTTNCDPTKPTNVTEVCSYSRYTKTCRLLSECGAVAGLPPSFAVATCECPETQPFMSPCVWSPQPCVYTPYYLPG